MIGVFSGREPSKVQTCTERRCRGVGGMGVPKARLFSSNLAESGRQSARVRRQRESGEREKEVRPTRHTTRRGGRYASGRGEKREKELFDEKMRAGNSRKQIAEIESDTSPPPGPLCYRFLLDPLEGRARGRLTSKTSQEVWAPCQVLHVDFMQRYLPTGRCNV